MFPSTIIDIMIFYIPSHFEENYFTIIISLQQVSSTFYILTSVNHSVHMATKYSIVLNQCPLLITINVSWTAFRRSFRVQLFLFKRSLNSRGDASGSPLVDLDVPALYIHIVNHSTLHSTKSFYFVSHYKELYFLLFYPFSYFYLSISFL